MNICIKRKFSINYPRLEKIFPTRIQDTKFIEYKKWCQSLDHTKYNFLNCLNPVKDMDFLKNKVDNEKNFSTDNILDVWYNHIGLPLEKNKIILSRGVRDSLSSILKYLKMNYQNIKCNIPEDIYPVYQQICDEVGVKKNEYFTLSNTHIKWQNILVNNNDPEVLLITDPHSLTGEYMQNNDLYYLKTWLNNNSNKWIIIDAVYNYTPHPNLKHPLLNEPRVFWCTSLSKTFISPLMTGIIATNVTELINDLQKLTYQPLDISKNIIIQNKYLPIQQQLYFYSAWKHLQMKYQKIIRRTPNNGYLLTLPFSNNYLMDKYNIVGIPLSVFGGTNQKTVISCLNIKEKINNYYYFTVVSNFAESYEKYNRIFTKNSNYTYPNKFFLCRPDDINAGLEKATKLLNKKNESNNKILVLESSQSDIKLESKYPVLESANIKVDNVYYIDNNNIIKSTVEDMYALSMKINQTNIFNWKDLSPRSISILPIAKGCQANCTFCFSHSSISQDQKAGNYESVLDNYLNKAKELGANRCVITGGGEPTLLTSLKLNKLIEKCKMFSKIVLITNGYKYTKMSEEERINELLQLQNSGLSILSISRHSSDININKKLMNLEIESEKVALTWKNNMQLFPKLKLRWICVLQKNGVDNIESLEKYLQWAVETGVTQICFKELYISSSYESIYYDSKQNEYCRENQVPLSMVINYCETNQWKLVEKLPWGSPIYEGKFNGVTLKIATYTEPSVYWERVNGICRSWNIMSNGECYASLEDRNSLIYL